jgi:hypothetical protein
MVPVQEAGSYGGGPMSVYIIEVDLTEEEIMEELDSKLKRNGRWNEEIKIIVLKEASS